jgi:hypothetical protein
MKAQKEEGGKRILLGDSRGCGRGYVAADRVPVRWSMDFSCTAFDVPIYI